MRALNVVARISCWFVPKHSVRDSDSRLAFQVTEQQLRESQ